ncbi:hypothetical protein dsx2_0481 [Desulfovibrio sp. X2]|uniref:hypothetical protein n=1 Tax=Desulfovibrio sp. X2 TaxID=941449 RepID=UPI000358CF34|nr:hypothetical protein [Desulfovibrio sp. X2]EPR38672.1 hypothetical protein dsx2_0481 [Desulfovibrio sp. X2]
MTHADCDTPSQAQHGSQAPETETARERRIERLNVLLLASSFLLTARRSEYASIFRGLTASAILLAIYVATGYDFALTGRFALGGALAGACWMSVQAVIKRRQIENARQELEQRAQEMRDLGVHLPPLGAPLPQNDPE